MRQLKITQQITNRDTQAFNKYLTEVGSIPLLSPEEETELAKRIQLGDKAALDKLIKGNLRFVISVAKQYGNKGMNLPDLIQEGNIGLAKAAEKFDEKRGFKFISYAVWWIRQSILQALAEDGKQIRLPLNKIGTLNRINQAKAELEQVFERMPTDSEISEYLINIELDKLNGDPSKYQEDKIKTILTQSSSITSLDSPMTNEDNSGTVGDLIEGESYCDINKIMKTKDLQIELDRILKSFPTRERDALVLYFGLFGSEQKSLEEIGMQFDLTRERVRQIKEKAIRKLKQRARRTALQEYR